MINEINVIIELIHEYKINEGIKRLLSLIEEIYSQINSSEKEKIHKFNEIMNYINIALENKDYLLLYDILENDLKYFLNLMTN